MARFDVGYFQKLDFSEQQLNQYFQAAANDLKIAEEAKLVEIIFRFSYDAFIKLGIAVIASQGYKVRSAIGHHVKIIEQLSQILDNKNIEIYGNHIRKLRNTDFYDGGTMITNMQAEDFRKFVQLTFGQAVKLYNFPIS